MKPNCFKLRAAFACERKKLLKRKHGETEPPIQGELISRVDQIVPPLGLQRREKQRKKDGADQKCVLGQATGEARQGLREGNDNGSKERRRKALRSKVGGKKEMGIDSKILFPLLSSPLLFRSLCLCLPINCRCLPASIKSHTSKETCREREGICLHMCVSARCVYHKYEHAQNFVTPLRLGRWPEFNKTLSLSLSLFKKFRIMLQGSSVELLSLITYLPSFTLFTGFLLNEELNTNCFSLPLNL